MTRNRSSLHSLGSWALLALAGTLGATSHAALRQDVEVPLSRVREGGTPYDPTATIEPYAISAALADEPTTGTVASPPEYGPTKGVLYRYHTSTWPTVVRDLVAALTGDPTTDEIAYVVVGSQALANSAAASFSAAGADLSRVVFFIQPSDSIWMRDYGPHFIYQDGSIAIVDSHYYPTRPLDNFIPTLLAEEEFVMQSYDTPLYYSGGNFQPGPNGSGFVTGLISVDNPASLGWTTPLIAEFYNRYQGIETLHVLPQLPTSVDGTGHIDMWFYMIDEDTVMISQFLAGQNPTAISITNNAVPYMQNLGFEVFRTPAWNAAGVHYTYTNAFRVNNRIFVPVYGTALVPGGSAAYNGQDAAAMATWQQAAGPGIEIIPIQCYGIIPAAGAIHCIVKQVPRYVDTMPAAVVVSPAGNEVWISGTTETIRWNATAYDNGPIASIDLHYSLDGGANWSPIATGLAHTGSYDWMVPAGSGMNAMIKVVARDEDANEIAAVSNPFRMGPGTAKVYDFTQGAGIDRFGFGFQTASWATIAGNMSPVGTALGSGHYTAMSASDATGGVSDPNRYISPTPSAGAESTHYFTFEIAEAPEAIDELKVVWEGFADRCTQAGIYVWDYSLNNWGDGRGLVGQHRHADSWAGTRDGVLEATMHENLADVLGGTNTLRILIYTQRPQDRTFHDHLAVTVKTLASKCPGDVNGDGTVDGSDLAMMLGQWGPCPGCNADFNDDGVIDGTDLAILLGGWGACD